MSIVYHYDASYLEIDVKWMIDEKCKLGEMFMIFPWRSGVACQMPKSYSKLQEE